jgi:uncharacterized membrane protein
MFEQTRGNYNKQPFLTLFSILIAILGFWKLIELVVWCVGKLVGLDAQVELE